MLFHIVDVQAIKPTYMHMYVTFVHNLCKCHPVKYVHVVIYMHKQLSDLVISVLSGLPFSHNHLYNTLSWVLTLPT